MPETPKKKPETEDAECGEPDDKRDLWESDQAERSYYYDDSHGYKVFEPDKDDEPEQKTESYQKPN